MNLGQLHTICGNSQYERAKTAFLYRLQSDGARFGMDAPEVMAQIVAQVAHESGRFRYVREVWGPTAAQKGYEGRADLGNTQPGDGKRFMGRDLIQCTGRANYRALTAWLRKRGIECPDFEAQPELLEYPAWIGVSVIWYFATRETRQGKHILEFCREGNVEMVSRMVNGGTNGLQDRLDLYTRAALVMLGRGPTGVAGFQQAAGLAAGGIAGPATRAALHNALVGLSGAPKTVAAPSAPEPKESLWAALFRAILGIIKGKAK
jgi:putative chitinase